MAALLATAGAGVAALSQGRPSWALRGFLLLQVSNMCFAAGQVAYRNLLRTLRAAGRFPASAYADAHVFATLYAGAALVTAGPALAALRTGPWPLSLSQLATLLYLGIVSVGLCFFLWNVGARQVRIGTLAVFNNVKLPLAVLTSAILWREPVEPVQLVLGGLLVVAAIGLSGAFGRRARAESIDVHTSCHTSMDRP